MHFLLTMTNYPAKTQFRYGNSRNHGAFNKGRFNYMFDLYRQESHMHMILPGMLEMTAGDRFPYMTPRGIFVVVVAPKDG